MSKLIMWNLMTLDGFFDGAENWALDWHQYAWGEELERMSIEQLRLADMLLFGRVTYEGMAAYWKTAQGEIAAYMNTLPKAVFSRTLTAADWQNTTLLKGDVKDEVQGLKLKGENNIFVFGSGNLSATLLEHGLFDEYRLCVVPVVLGTGKQLFGRKLSRVRMKLLESRPLASGSVLLRYAPFAESSPETPTR
ncbi:MAG TPA: dihydrofolate reductase family protein [Candidatus Acidoferrum sp.]|nr:dihydrofolate reductase family protein [Candidatus Acidoferrum sp.]